MMKFELHPRLAQDCLSIGHFDLCQLLLMNDRQYPWFILVPKIPDLTEIYQLNAAQRQQLMTESCYLTETLEGIFKADKMNLGSLGNIVPQLHIHHIVRHQSDPAWPGPVWGKYTAIAYEEVQIRDILQRLKHHLQPFRFEE